MRGTRLALVAALALALTPGGALQAQTGTGPSREGFWWGFGVGYAAPRVFCDICDSNRRASVSAGVRMGGTVSPGLLLGGELNGWTRSNGPVGEYMGTLGGLLYWYPNPAGSFYLKAGLSYVAYRIDDGQDAITSSGFGPQVGAGYEIGIRRNLTIVPFFNSIVTLPTGNLQLNGDRQATGVSLALVQLGIGLTWH